MGGELSIKVVIANRTYPLIIKQEEEEGVRKAAKLIEKRMKELEENYSVKDKQDLLAMCALQFANQAGNEESSPSVEQKDNGNGGEVEQLHMLDQLLANYLQQDTTP